MAGESAHFGLRQRPPTPAIRPFELPPRMQPMLGRARAGLAEPFHGIGTGPDGTIAPGIFTTGKTGVSLTPLVAAACHFLAGLPAPQRQAAARFAIGDDAWRQWSNIHPWLMRHGVCLADLGHDQREAALGLIRESLSAAGYQLAHDVMRLNEHALEVTGKPEEYSEWFYWVSIFGMPSADEPWGFQIDSHPPQPQRLCARRPACHDADLHGVGVGLGALWQIQGNAGLRRGGGRLRLRADGCLVGWRAAAGDDRQRPARRSC